VKERWCVCVGGGGNKEWKTICYVKHALTILVACQLHRLPQQEQRQQQDQDSTWTIFRLNRKIFAISRHSLNRSERKMERGRDGQHTARQKGDTILEEFLESEHVCFIIRRAPTRGRGGGGDINRRSFHRNIPSLRMILELRNLF
jgi:hypothetical protein